MHMGAGACASQRHCIPLGAGVSGSCEQSEGGVTGEVTRVFWKSSVCTSPLINVSNPINI